MHNVSFEELRKPVPVGSRGCIFIYRQHTEFSQFVMDVVDHIQDLGLQRIVILVQKGVGASVVEDATQRIAEIIESNPSPVHRKIALECFHDLTRADLRRIKREWKRSQKEK